MDTSTTDALFRFQVKNLQSTDGSSSDEPIYIEHTHPVPIFLTQPTPSKQHSQAFTSAFIDVLSIVSAQHHSECMSLLSTSPCPSCAKLATDCLKTPNSYLHLAEPIVIISITPTCGQRDCERAIRASILQTQKREMEQKREDAWSGRQWMKMKCDVCGAEDGKRCAGCGTVAYCGRECQKRGWKGHRRFCERKKIGQDLEGVRAPVEII
ncbi:hypothetical protein ACLMJK_009475 [Lecanora helva]